MIKKYSVTEVELVEIFKRWNDSYLSEPESFKDIDNAQKDSENQAEEFVRILTEVKKETIIAKK